PAVERHSRDGDPFRFSFPTPLKGRAEPHFSFSGLKTAVRRQAQKLAPLNIKDVSDLCASFEYAVCDVIRDRVIKAYEVAKNRRGHTRLPLVAAGGVARNQRLRQTLKKISHDLGSGLFIPPPDLCSDNGAMVAWAGAQRYINGYHDNLDFSARSRWPLDEKSTAVYGFGRNGPKV
ncbi:MAG: tRNA (adenosine(37)-N6)-threonylcarbamoyltransferase complex transferase subunit TsaD, partial [Hyphomicrobiaceae bacterium]|nr:tRNA (adenosine(37)-N6)-threonylcarbamoyltransferase complex transferase subunit TsaD [Hyphomicrobiaceae bacterium]